MEKGISNSNVRTENRKKLIKLLYWNDGVSKQDISMGMRLSMPTVNLLISQLDEQGLIEKRRAAASSGGRIPDLFYFKYDAKLSVGVEISNDYCVVLITDLAGKEKAYKKIKARFNDSRTYWLGVRALILQMITENGYRREDILGVGIALQNSMDNNSKVMEPTILADSRPSQIEKLDVLLGFPVMVESTTNAAGFANIWSNEEINKAIYLSVSEEIVGVIIDDKRIVHGVEGRCGEIGHMKLVPGGKKCSCGRDGCVNVYCSTSILKKAVNDELSNFFALLPHSEALEKIWDSYSDKLAVLISNLNMLMDFPVILGGELGKYAGGFELELEQKIEKDNPYYSGKILRPAVVCEHAPATGAALMIAAYYLDLLGEV